MSNFEANNIPDFGSINANKPKQLNKFIIQGFYDSIDEFIQYFSANSKHSTCPVSWNTLSLACSCKDCQISSNNCACVKCFLEGPHKYHRCSVSLSSLGNCDCGDYSAWKPSGTCKYHRTILNNPSSENMQSNDDDYFVSNVDEIPNCPLPGELKRRLLISFNEIKKDIEKMIETANFEFFEICCKWYFNFTQLGDEIRNCIIDTFNDKIFLMNIILNAKNLNDAKMKSFFNLTGALANNNRFISIFMESIVQVLPNLLQLIRNSATVPFQIFNDIPCVGISTVLRYGYQYTNNFSVRILTELNKFDWSRYILNINDIICDFIHSAENYKSFLNFQFVFKILETYKFILREIFRMKSEEHKMKHFFIEFAKSCEKIEGFCPQLNDNSQCHDLRCFILRLFKFPHIIKKNIQYFVPEIFDIFIFHLLNDEEFKERRKNIKNYSMSTLLHQLFISDLLIFNRKNKIENVFNNDELFNVCYEGKNPKETFDYYCILNLKRKGINCTNHNELINDIYFKAIELPMASISFHYLFKYIKKELNMSNLIKNAINGLHEAYEFKIYIFPRLISIVQVMFSFTSKERKDEMISFIANSFEALKSKYNLTTQKMRDFTYLFFICTLILDRDCINEDTISICLKNLMTSMKYNTLNSTQIHNLIRPYDLTKEKFIEKYNKMNIGTDWNLIIPCCCSPESLYNEVIPQIIGKTQDLLLPFPEFVENSFLMNLKEIFECKFLFASIFYLIYEYNNDQVMMQYALNLFIACSQNSKHIENDDLLNNQKIVAKNFDELAEKIPTTNFRLFAKMNVCFKGNTGISLIQLIDDLGLIGLATLRQTGLSEKVVNQSKKKIKKMKKEIMNEFNKKRQKFDSTIDRQSHNCCSICHKILTPIESNSRKNQLFLGQNEKLKIDEDIENKLLYIPVVFFKSVSVDLIEDLIHNRFNKDSVYVKKYYVKTLLKYKFVHSNCYSKENHNQRHVLLMPKIDSLCENFGIVEIKDFNGYVNVKIKEKIFNFLQQANLMQHEGVKMLARMISVLDHRSRLAPEILDDSNVFILYSNLFKNCSLLVGILSNSDEFNSIEKVIFLSFSIFFMTDKETDFIKNEFENVLKIREDEKLEKIDIYQYLFSKNVKINRKQEENHHEYLRRCFLIEIFYLTKNKGINETFIDWDSILSYENLYSHFYHKKLTDQKIEKLPVFRGLNLPKYFLELIYPPFNVSFLSILKNNCSICLLTGFKYENKTGLKAKFGMPFTIVLECSGRKISSVSILNGGRLDDIKRIHMPIYVDKNGLGDSGFTRGSNLMLSQERYNKLIDAYLSGDVIDKSFS